MITILFVCTANRYRSPIAAACFKNELIKRNQEKDWDVSSAGTWTMDGLPPVPDAILVARQLGLDIQEHRSRAVTSDMLQQVDLVLVMERGQKEALQIEFQAYRQKIALLTEVAEGTLYDIADPMTDPRNVNAGSEIYRLIHAGFEKICAQAIENSKGH
jgi:protein-tyrosine phosphatase